MVWTRNHLIEPYIISLLSHNFPLYPLSPSEVHQLERDVITVLRNAEITAELRTRMEAAQQQARRGAYQQNPARGVQQLARNTWLSARRGSYQQNPARGVQQLARNPWLSATRAQINQGFNGLPPPYSWYDCQNNWMPRPANWNTQQGAVQRFQMPSNQGSSNQGVQLPSNQQDVDGNQPAAPEGEG